MYQYGSVSSQLLHPFWFPTPFLTLPAGTQRHSRICTQYLRLSELKKKEKNSSQLFQSIDFSTMEYFLTRDFSDGDDQFFKG